MLLKYQNSATCIHCMGWVILETFVLNYYNGLNFCTLTNDY